MDNIDVVKNFNAYKKLGSERIGFFTFNDEPPSIIDGRPLY